MTAFQSSPRAQQRWLTPGVGGIGLASLLADTGHEIGTSLLPAFLSGVLGAPPAALGLIEGVADGLSGIARLVGGALADDPGRRRGIAVGGYALTAVLSATIGLATAAWQVAVLRAGAWTARGIRVPSRNALLADAVDPAAYGRAYGFERTMDNFGAILGPLLALALVGALETRGAILVSVVPGLLAAVAIAYAVRHIRRPVRRERTPIRLEVGAVLATPLRGVAIPIAAFEAGNVAATLLILRAGDVLGGGAASVAVLGLYAAYNAAATVTSFPAGRIGDHVGMTRVFGFGVGCFAAAYLLFAIGAGAVGIGAGFLLAGIGIGCVETAEHAIVAQHAPAPIRGSAFGLLAAIQSAGDFAASAVVGLVWTLVGPAAAFTYAAVWMILALLGLPAGRFLMGRAE